ncbi:MAG TPA: hypothetical protein VFA30_09380 [Gaiellaceae bacterium]|nr:hypothetical protein [Gaiellaceae bacterium]
MSGTSSGLPRGQARRGKQLSSRTVAGDDSFDAASANAEMTAKLRRNSLQRRAQAQGLRLRHSTYGYSLVEQDGSRVVDRNDLTLDEVDVELERHARTSPPSAAVSRRR